MGSGFVSETELGFRFGFGWRPGLLFGFAFGLWPGSGSRSGCEIGFGFEVGLGLEGPERPVWV